MGHQDEQAPERQEPPVPVGYEPPRVEQILGPSELEREVLYAGLVVTLTDQPA